MEPMSNLTVELDGGSEEEVLVHAWRAEQLRHLGLPRTLAFVFAGVVAELVESGCAPE